VKACKHFVSKVFKTLQHRANGTKQIGFFLVDEQVKQEEMITGSRRGKKNEPREIHIVESYTLSTSHDDVIIVANWSMTIRSIFKSLGNRA